VRSFKSYYNNLVLIGLVVLPLILFFIDVESIEKKQSLCFSVVFFNQECYGCGMGRALLNLLHFNFLAAYHFNPLSFIVFPMFTLIWIKELFEKIKTIKNNT
jgi:hypothetical protein